VGKLLVEVRLKKKTADEEPPKTKQPKEEPIEKNRLMESSEKFFVNLWRE
jgi:hypothetical protein